MTQRVRRWPHWRDDVSVGVGGGGGGDDSDFYHREMNSDCSSLDFSYGGSSSNNGIFRAATPSLIHSTPLYC